MYYSKQIPYLLDKDFKNNIQYEEYSIKELSTYCMCIWTIKSIKVLNKTIYNYILPDACIDIVIDFSNKNICFAGFSNETVPFELNRKIDYMGVRLKPSAFYTLFGISADKVMNNVIPFWEVEHEIKIDEIFNLTNIDERLIFFKNYLLKKINNKTDKQFLEIVEALYESPKDQSVITISKKFGYNERHLYRLFKTNYGVSPKVMLNILRLHLCLTLILEENLELIDVANLCGFYDQSHFIKDIKRYTGFSPLKLIQQYK